MIEEERVVAGVSDKVPDKPEPVPRACRAGCLCDICTSVSLDAIHASPAHYSLRVQGSKSH